MLGQFVNLDVTRSSLSMVERESTTAKSILRAEYTRLICELNVPQLSSILYEKQLIEVSLKEKIEKAEITKDANKLYIDHLSTTGTVSSVEHFSHILIDTSKDLTNEVHRQIGKDLLDIIRNRKKSSAAPPRLDTSSTSFHSKLLYYA